MKTNKTSKPIYVPVQYPLDIKHYVKTVSELVDLGENNQKAYTYYNGMFVMVADTGEIYRWIEWTENGGLPGLLPDGFTYPSCLDNEYYDYAGRTFNFVRVYIENDYTPYNDNTTRGVYFFDHISDLDSIETPFDERQVGVKYYDDGSGEEEAYLIYQYCATCTDAIDGYNVVKPFNVTDPSTQEGRWILKTRLKYADRLDGMESRNEEPLTNSNAYIPVADTVKNPQLNSDLLDNYQTREERNNQDDPYIPVADGDPNPELNSDMLDGFDARIGATPGNGYVPIADGVLNTDLNSDMLDGRHAGNSTGDVPINNAQLNENLNADMLEGKHASLTPTANNIPISDNNHKIDNGWLRTGHGNGLDADMVDGKHASSTPTSNTIPVANSNHKIDNGWLNTGHGNGLDADTLDGFHASDIINSVTESGVYSFNTQMQFNDGEVRVIAKSITNSPRGLLELIIIDWGGNDNPPEYPSYHRMLINIDPTGNINLFEQSLNTRMIYTIQIYDDGNRYYLAIKTIGPFDSINIYVRSFSYNGNYRYESYNSDTSGLSETEVEMLVDEHPRVLGGINKFFSFQDAGGHTHSINIFGGIITKWDIT